MSQFSRLSRTFCGQWPVIKYYANIIYLDKISVTKKRSTWTNIYTSLLRIEYLYLYYKSTHLKYSSALYSQGVLVDFDDFSVL